MRWQGMGSKLRDVAANACGACRCILWRGLMRAPIGAIAAGLLLATHAQAATGPNIGTTAVAKNEVTGTQGAARRALKGGDVVFQDERIATGSTGAAQLLFRDATALTLGPNTEVILDTFVYDPNRGTGEMKIRAMTGAFRFVTDR